MKIITKRKTIEFGTKTLLMGILNVTPDSFSDGGLFFDTKSAITRAKALINEGADIIDVGGESSRPGAEKVTLEEELKRVIPVIEGIRGYAGDEITISIDTYKSIVAREAISKGADIINDVSGMRFDPEMMNVVAELRVPIVINHIRGEPKTMQKGKIKYKDVVTDIGNFFAGQIKTFEEKKIPKQNIILDPGFGFGKTVEQNLEIIRRFSEFKHFRRPLLIGISRKSTIGTLLSNALRKEISPAERLEGTLAATAIAVLQGANIVRTHDIYQTKKFLIVLDEIKTKQKTNKRS